jgi:hypothetical protein
MRFFTMYGNRSKVLFPDTDLLCLHIETENLHEDLLQDLDKYDTSNYAEANKLDSKINAKVVGKMKDECAGKHDIDVAVTRPIAARTFLINIYYNMRSKKFIEAVKQPSCKHIVLALHVTVHNSIRKVMRGRLKSCETRAL